MAAMNPSPTKPIVRYPTALLEDKELVTLHDTRLPDYKAFEYGTPFPDQAKYPGLKLVFQEPLGEDDRMVRRVWAGERADQDLYNSDRKYSGGSMEHPIIIRRYLFPEDGYAPLPSGTNDSQFPDAVLVDEEVTRPENRNGFLAVTRVFETIPGPLLTGILVTEKGQSATITTQIVAPGTVVTPSALTLSASVKPDGKGKSVLEKVEVPEVFSEKSFAIENPDPVPQKFRIAAPSTTTEETVVGDAAQPVLATGELAASEQQVTKFTKRTRKTSRSTSALPKSLTQTTTNEQGLKATVIETLQVGDTSDTPSATVSVESEAMGDGTYVVRKTTLPEVFDQEAVSVQKPDVVPERYRASVPSTTTVNVVAATAASTPTLSVNDLEKSEQRVSAFTVKRATTSRGSQTYPTLHGQGYDSSIGVVIPYIEKIVSSGAEAGSDLTEVTPLSDQLDLARTIDVDLLKSTLDAIHLEFPSRTTLSLPPVLESVDVVWDTFSDQGNFSSDWSGQAQGVSWSLAGSERGEAKSIAGVTPSFVTKMKDTWATNIPTTTHVFFLPYPCTEAHILSKVNAAKWPTFKPESATITAFGQKIGVSVEANASAAQSQSRYENDALERAYNTSWDRTVGVGASKSLSQSVVVAHIPACLHGSIPITNPTQTEYVNASISIGWLGINFPSVSVNKSNSGTATGSVHGSLPATSPSDIPRSGKYLIDSKVDIYQHGYLKVYAEVLDASVLA